MNETITSVSLQSGTSFGNDIIQMVINAGSVSQGVMILLFLFSLGSWGIILDKWLQFRKTEKLNVIFLDLFRKANDFKSLMVQMKNIKHDALSRIFLSGYKALLKKQPDAEKTVLLNQKLDTRLIEMSLDDAILIETQILEKRLSFLGTTASVSPFLGLFGTVWGILSAFHGIGLIGSASIAAVAPGIAEALSTTAAGLIAAVPAVIAYNYFLGRARTISVSFERFRSSFLASLE